MASKNIAKTGTLVTRPKTSTGTRAKKAPVPAQTPASQKKVRPAAGGLATSSAMLPRGSDSSRLDVGAKFPDATLVDQHGKSFRLASLKGDLAVVYFYPRDDTSGCTREACAFQEHLGTLTRLGVKVVGISPDSATRHAKFAEKYALRFTLLVDEDRSYSDCCGVLVPKTLYGRTSIGIERSTFLIDKRGVVLRVWRKVKVDGHVDQVTAAIRELA